MAVLSELSRALDSKKFNVSGGGLNGDISFSDQIHLIGMNRTDGYLRIGTKSNEQGASLWFYGGESESVGGITHATDGMFRLRSARKISDTETKFNDFTGDTEGNLKWSGYNVVCVLSWKSGNNWYRKYSNGWIEQGGYTPRSIDGFSSVTFPLAFSQDNPNVQFTRRFYYDNDSTATQNRTSGVSSVTKTGFKCYDNGWSASGGSCGVWLACGY